MRKVYNYLFFICIGLLFTSCENFYKGTELSKEIGAKIEYERYSPVRINIAADANTGSAFPTSEKNLRPTDKLDISFEVAKNYIFKYWEIIDLNTKEKIDNVIRIENPNSLKTTIEVLKETSASIWIRPVCIEKLNVAFSPAMTTDGVPKNTSLVLNFNHPVKEDSFKYFIEDSVEANNLTGHYLKPDFSDEGKTVIIRANPANLPFTNDSGQRNIKFTLSPDTGFEDELVTFDKEYSWTYKINNERDFDPPVIRSLVANKIGRYGEVVPEPLKYRPYNGNAYDFDNSDGNNNYVMNKLKFTFSAYDEVSGIGKIIVQEKLLYTNTNEKTPEYQYVIENEYCVNELPMDGSIQNGEFVYDFRQTENNDGVVEVKFIPVDYCGNRETDENKIPVFIVLRDTLFREEPFSITNYVDFIPNTQKLTSVNKINEDIKTVRITGVDNCFYYTTTELKDLDIKIYCGTDVNNLQQASYNYVERKNQINFYYDSLSATQDNYLKITGLDMVGNELSILRMIPKSITPLNGYKKSETSYSVLYGDIKTDMPGTLGYKLLDLKTGTDLNLFTNESNVVVTPSAHLTNFKNKKIEYTWSTNIVLTYPCYIVDINNYKTNEDYVNTLFGPVSIYKIPEQQTGNDIIVPEIITTVIDNPDVKKQSSIEISFSTPLENGIHFYIKHSDSPAMSSESAIAVDKNEFTVNRGKENKSHYLQVCAYTADGRSGKSEIIEIEIPGYGDIDVDPPDFECDDFVFDVFKGGLKMELWDKSGFKEENNKAVLQYWFIPSTFGSIVLDYSTLTAKYGNGRKVYFENKKDEYVEVLLPFAGITAGTYRLYLCVEDAAGNISFGDAGSNYQIEYSTENIEYIYENKDLSVNNSGYEELKVYEYNAENCDFYRRDCFGKKLELQENSFYAVNLSCFLDWGYKFTVPYYFYSGTGSKVTCNKKTLAQITDTAYTVSSDQPYLVQTLYNTVNYGNDKDLWELFSTKTGLEQFSGYQIYAVDTSDLLDGDYYVVKAYYADGTTKMSEPVKVIK